MKAGRARPAVFFDRDGIVNVSPGPGYVERPEDFHLIPEFLDALRIVRERGYAAVIVTNQRGVGLGRFSREMLDRIHGNLIAAVRAAGLDLTDILVCTAVTDDDPRRKPNPGMLLEAADRHRLDLRRSWMIGDSAKDIEAGRRAGCAVTVKVGAEADAVGADHCVPNMRELVELLRRQLPAWGEGCRGSSS
ncbi:MAG: HAD-IIIA family hydrolase [Kiritimatiellae bacterium]|nr:HAD-IIIA family hydrolase [Kiritimatiellia bacterium]